jgi:hypothetical protein
LRSTGSQKLEKKAYFPEKKRTCQFHVNTERASVADFCTPGANPGKVGDHRAKSTFLVAIARSRYSIAPASGYLARPVDKLTLADGWLFHQPHNAGRLRAWCLSDVAGFGQTRRRLRFSANMLSTNKKR